MRVLASALLAAGVLLIPAAPALATPVSLRIEGQSRTIFEGQIDTSGHNVQSLSERSTGAIRRCDGTNNGAGSGAAPTPTATAFDALALSGQGFDGDWYDDFQDYLVSRLGPEYSQNWGLLRNGVATSTGGCQTRLNSGDRVIWVAGGANPPLTLSQPSPTTVKATDRTGAAVGGASIATVSSSGEIGGTVGATADGTGIATVPAGGTYKAVKAGYTRSNRVPVDTSVLTAPTPVFYGPSGTPIADSPALATTVTPLRLGRARAGSSAYRRGRIAVRWSIARQGPGLLRWSIGADDLSTKAKRYVVRAKGISGSSALVRLPAGRSYALRFTSVDRLRNTDSADAGRVVVPIDDRAKAVRRSGRWSKAKASTAWAGTVLRGRSGSRLRVKLAAGRPVLLLRGRRAGAVLRVTAGRTTRTVRVRATRTGAHQLVSAFRRARSGPVSVLVVRGAVDLDGVAVRP